MRAHLGDMFVVSRPQRHSLVLVLLALSTAGCGERAAAPGDGPLGSANASTGGSAASIPVVIPPSSEPVGIDGLDMGSALNGFEIAERTAVFDTGQPVYLTVASNGGMSARIGVRGVNAGGATIYVSEREIAPGPQTTLFDIDTAPSLPPGEYRLDITLNGSVARSRNFTIQ